MAPHTVATPPESGTAKSGVPGDPASKNAKAQTSVLEKGGQASTARDAAGVPAHRAPALFAEALLENNELKQPKRAYSVVVSVIFQVILLSIAAIIPLLFSQQLDLKQFTRTFLAAPPPPPPPPPAPTITKLPAAQMKKISLIQAGRLVAPTAIPKRIVIVKDEQMPQVAEGFGVPGGVPGGVGGGQAGGVIGGILGGIPSTASVPPPPPAVSKAPLRVGGRVKPPRPISTPRPMYPQIARAARIQGDVVIDAVIDTNGNISQMKLISGHPMLVGAAMEALRQWKYEPTYLDEQPVSIELNVTISFSMQ